jgi:hypothetical protein
MHGVGAECRDEAARLRMCVAEREQKQGCRTGGDPEVPERDGHIHLAGGEDSASPHAFNALISRVSPK